MSFSSFRVLAYYANASAWTLVLVLVFALPASSVISGAAVLAAVAAAYAVRRAVTARRA
ncbi:hypothetical protein RIU97_38455 [Streptomyces sp. 147326]